MQEHPDERALADEPLSPEVVQHLQGCPRCRVSRKLMLALGTPAPVQDRPVTLDPRYRWLGLLGAGGMGEVFRVRDEILGREVALKVLRGQLQPRVEARFAAEAKVTAQLQHPSIVPLYELGHLPDGRLFYTMPVLEGRTLAERLAQGGVRPLVAALHQVASAVGYAHVRGVVHRDLKPANIMLGSLGAVYVLDWGLSIVLGEGEDPPVVERDAFETRPGTVAGTPAYMAPEQALRGLRSAGPPADVYAIGAMLYEILSGSPPYVGPTDVVLSAVRQGPPPPLRALSEAELELGLICDKAMAREPGRRHPDAGALAEALGRWLDGEAQRERAMALVTEARALQPEVERLHERAQELSRQAQAQAQQLAPQGPLAERVALWALEDEAARLHIQAEGASARLAERLSRALAVSPELPEARSELGAWYRRQLLSAEARRDEGGVARWAELLAGIDREAHREFLRGEGLLETLLTEPAGAKVTWMRGEVHERRIRWVPAGELGRTPLPPTPLPMGTHLLLLEHEDCETVRYPVWLGRCGRWSTSPPGAGPLPVVLPLRGSLAPDEVYVPGGWFHKRLGGVHRPVWVDPFVIGRFPVTNRQYIAFLDALGERGSELVPLRPSTDTLAPMLKWSGTRFVETEGDPFHPDVPVVYLRWASAMTFAQEHGYRLPSELEWEKAAAGVDGRTFPWGEHSDPAWANTLHSRAKPWPASIYEYPEDESVYGVRGVAGNVADWVLDPFVEPGPRIEPDGRAGVAEQATSRGFRSTRGGAWIWHHRYSACAYRTSHRAEATSAELGFRLARSPAHAGARAV